MKWKKRSDANCSLRCAGFVRGVGICLFWQAAPMLRRAGTPMAFTAEMAVTPRCDTVHPFIMSAKFVRRYETTPEYCSFHPCCKPVRILVNLRSGQAAFANWPSYAIRQRSLR